MVQQTVSLVSLAEGAVCTPHLSSTRILTLFTGSVVDHWRCLLAERLLYF